MPLLNLLFFILLLLALSLGLCSKAIGAPTTQDAEVKLGNCQGRVLVGDDTESYVCMDPVRASVRLNSAKPVILDITFSIDVPERKPRQKVLQKTLFLQAAYGETIRFYSGQIYKWGDVPDFDQIKEMLQQDTDRMIGKNKARILIDSIVLHQN